MRRATTHGLGGRDNWNTDGTELARGRRERAYGHRRRAHEAGGLGPTSSGGRLSYPSRHSSLSQTPAPKGEARTLAPREALLHAHVLYK